MIEDYQARNPFYKGLFLLVRERRNNCYCYFHVLEHLDQFKAIKKLLRVVGHLDPLLTPPPLRLGKKNKFFKGIHNLTGFFKGFPQYKLCKFISHKT